MCSHFDDGLLSSVTYVLPSCVGRCFQALPKCCICQSLFTVMISFALIEADLSGSLVFLHRSTFLYSALVYAFKQS